MAHPAYIQKHLFMKPEVIRLFELNESYLQFCKDFGYAYNEADVENYKTYPWQQYQKYANRKHVKNNWDDAVKGISYQRSGERKPAARS